MTRHHVLLAVSLLGAAVILGVAVRTLILRMEASPEARLDEGWIKVDRSAALPPAPDPARTAATLAGVDSNNNSVRDDVERRIAEAWGLHTERAEALRHAAITVQGVIATGGQVWLAQEQGRASTINADDLRRMQEQTTLAGACVLKTFGADYGDDGRKAGEVALHNVVAVLLDTPERQYAYSLVMPLTQDPVSLQQQQPLFFLNPCDGLLRLLSKAERPVPGPASQSAPQADPQLSPQTAPQPARP
jgi:hypothetical protein